MATQNTTSTPAVVVAAIPATALALFSETEANKFQMMADGLTRLQSDIGAATITSPEIAADVQRVLAEAKRALKTIDDARLAQTKPLRDQVATINDTWGRITAGLENVARACDAKIRSWNARERERLAREEQERREAAARAEREAEAARKAAEVADDDAARQAAYEAAEAAEQQLARADEALLAAEQMPRGIKTDSGTTSSVWPWVFKITDETKIPREFLMVNEKAIRAAVNAGTRQIEGVYIYQEEKLRTVTR